MLATSVVITTVIVLLGTEIMRWILPAPFSEGIRTQQLAFILFINGLLFIYGLVLSGSIITTCMTIYLIKNYVKEKRNKKRNN